MVFQNFHAFSIFRSLCSEALSRVSSDLRRAVWTSRRLRFETIGDLLAQLLRFGPRPTVELMRTVNAAGRAETLAYFQQALRAIS